MSKPWSTAEKASLEEVHQRSQHRRAHRKKRTSTPQILLEDEVRLCSDDDLGTASMSLRPEGKSYSFPVKQSCLQYVKLS
jgi:hypothetical protein